VEAKIFKLENELKSSEEEGKQLKALYTEKKTKFEEASSSLQAARSNNKVLSFLMEQQDKGAISGIYVSIIYIHIYLCLVIIIYTLNIYYILI